jgi:hypothetical protein
VIFGIFAFVVFVGGRFLWEMKASTISQQQEGEDLKSASETDGNDVNT